MSFTFVQGGVLEVWMLGWFIYYSIFIYCENVIKKFKGKASAPTKMNFCSATTRVRDSIEEKFRDSRFKIPVLKLKSEISHYTQELILVIHTPLCLVFTYCKDNHFIVHCPSCKVSRHFSKLLCFSKPLNSPKKKIFPLNCLHSSFSLFPMKRYT